MLTKERSINHTQHSIKTKTGTKTTGNKWKTVAKMVDTSLTGEGNGSPLLYSCLEKSMDSPWLRRELDTAEQLNTHKSNYIKQLDHKEG